MMRRLTLNQELHREYLKSPVWQAKRIEALKIFGPVCSRCGRHGTDVHHKTYARTGGAERMTDLEILCRSCHEAHHASERSMRRKVGRRAKSVNRQAIHRCLSSWQKSELMHRFQIETVGAFYLGITQSRDETPLIQAAKAMLGVKKTHRSTVKARPNQHPNKKRFGIR